MTTVAMAAGMLPTALGIGEGAEFRQPMAIAVIGGLMSSTALSLVFVPVIYEIVDSFELWITPKLARFITRSEEHTSELQSLMRNSYAVFCLKKKTKKRKKI